MLWAEQIGEKRGCVGRLDIEVRNGLGGMESMGRNYWVGPVLSLQCGKVGCRTEESFGLRENPGLSVELHGEGEEGQARLVHWLWDPG